MNETLNIVNVARRFVRDEWGGTETVILETSKALRSRGHSAEVLCPNALADCDFELMDGVPILRTPYFYPYIGLSADARRAMDKKGGNLFSLALLRNLIGRDDLDLLHAHTGKRLGGIVRHVARKRNIPYVVSLHGGVFDVPQAEQATWTEPAKDAFEWGKVLGWWVGSRRVLDDAAAILCVGQREQQLTQERFPDKNVIYLPNGVDLDRFAEGDGSRFRHEFGIADSAELITVVGRLDVQKNQLLAVESLSELRSRRPDAHLALIGHVTNADYLSQVRQRITELDLEDRVTIIPGLDPDSGMLQAAYHASDLFLLPSTHEPFGIVILEAWAAGLPVVAANVGGVRTLVDDQQDGLLFPSGDQAALTKALLTMLEHPELRRRLAEQGKAKTEQQYSWRRITDRLLDVYQEVLR